MLRGTVTAVGSHRCRIQLRGWFGFVAVALSASALTLAINDDTQAGDQWRATTRPPSALRSTPSIASGRSSQTATKSVTTHAAPRVEPRREPEMQITPGWPLQLKSIEAQRDSTPVAPISRASHSAPVAGPENQHASGDRTKFVVDSPPATRGWKSAAAPRTPPQAARQTRPHGSVRTADERAHDSSAHALQPAVFSQPPRALDLTEAADAGSLPRLPERQDNSVAPDGGDEPQLRVRNEAAEPLDAEPPGTEPLETVPPIPGGDVLTVPRTSEQVRVPRFDPPLPFGKESSATADLSEQPLFGNVPHDPAAEVVNIPFKNADTVVTRRDFELRMNNGLITLIANDASLSDILAILAQDHGLNIVCSNTLTNKVTVTLRDVPLADALNAVLSIQGLAWSRRNDIISISKIATDQTSGGALVQGRIIRVYQLSYVMGTDVEPIVKSLLSPVGQAKTMESPATDSRKTADRLIVEDLPDYLDRVDSCIKQLDRPPRQVQIEAHILEVDLSTDTRHGVNLEAMSDIAGTDLSFKTTGFAKSTSSPAMLFGIDGSKVDLLLDALKNTVDARTLASPHVLVTHGQQAKIQIGGKLGYRQSTTTETSTVQSVAFLDVGVVLTVTPYIGENGQILMKVTPEVSDGLINLDTELPDETITTVDSTVLLNDGQGMIIGGLIRENDDDVRNKANFLGELWMVGRLFQKMQQTRGRKEVIVVLVPRIVDCPCPIDGEQAVQLERAQTKLFHGALKRNDRPWEAELPDVVYRPGEIPEYIREFHRTEGATWTPEPQRSGGGYFDDYSPQVPVTIETLPIESGGIPMSDAPTTMRSGQAISQVSATRPVDDRQYLPNTKKPSFFGSQRKSESKPEARGMLNGVGRTEGRPTRSVPNAPSVNRTAAGR